MCVRNREVRESCIHYVYLALEGWSSAALERFRTPLQTAIAVRLGLFFYQGKVGG